MTSDWNWFFSSVAQSSAAIVGIFAAFIITKIINNQLEFDKLTRYTEGIISESEKLIEQSRATRIAWYNDTVFKIETLKLVEALRTRQINEPEQYAFRWRFSPLAPKWYMEEKLSEFFRELKQKSVGSGRSIKDLLIGSEPSANLLISLHEQDIKEEAEKINNLINEIRHNVREIKSLLGTITKHPQSSRLVTFSIIGSLLMFIIGVILPLYVIPINTLINTEPSESLAKINVYSTNLKSFIIGAVALIFFAIMLVFVWINIRMKYPKNIFDKLNAYSEMERYSPYFKDIDEKFTLR